MNIFAAIKLAFVIPFRVALGRASSTAAALSSIPMIYIYIYIYMYIIYRVNPTLSSLWCQPLPQPGVPSHGRARVTEIAVH